MFGRIKTLAKNVVKLPSYVMPPTWTDNMELRVASGSINLTDPLDCFLYMLLREHLSPSKVEALMTDQEDFLAKHTVQEATNGWVAQHAQNLAHRLRRPSNPLSIPLSDGP